MGSEHLLRGMPQLQKAMFAYRVLMQWGSCPPGCYRERKSKSLITHRSWLASDESAAEGLLLFWYPVLCCRHLLMRRGLIRGRCLDLRMRSWTRLVVGPLVPS